MGHQRWKPCWRNSSKRKHFQCVCLKVCTIWVFAEFGGCSQMAVKSAVLMSFRCWILAVLHANAAVCAGEKTRPKLHEGGIYIRTRVDVQRFVTKRGFLNGRFTLPDTAVEWVCFFGCTHTCRTKGLTEAAMVNHTWYWACQSCC